MREACHLPGGAGRNRRIGGQGGIPLASCRPPPAARRSLHAAWGSGGSRDEQQKCGGVEGFAVGEQPCEAAAAAQRLVACAAAPKRPDKHLPAAAQVPRPTTPLPPPFSHAPERYSPPVGRLAGPPPRPPRERGREELKAAAPRPAPASTAPPWPAASSARCGGSGRPGIPRSSGRSRGTAPAMLMPLRCRRAERERGGKGGSQRDGWHTVPLPICLQPPGYAAARCHSPPKVLPWPVTVNHRLTITVATAAGLP